MASTTQDVFAKARGHERAEQLRAAREADLLPYFRTLEGPAGPVVEMEGAERIMLGSNNYLGLTGDERVIQGAADALQQVRHRPDRLAPAERHDLAAPRARARDRRVDGHRGGARLLDGRAGQPHARSGRCWAPATRSSSTPATTPRSWTAASSAARSCARFATTSSTSSSARSARRRRTAAAILVVVDGVFSMEGDVAPLPEIADLCERFGARLMVDEAHGAGVLGARGAGASELHRRRGSRRPADGDVLQEPRELRRLPRRHARGHRLPARPEPRVPLHGGRRCPRPLGAALAAVRIVRSDEGPRAAGARARQRRLPARRAARARLQVVEHARATR